MKTLLVPVDFSAVTDQVIESAIALTRAFGGRATLLHVVQAPIVATAEFALPVEAMQEAITASQKAAREKLVRYTERFRRAGLDCTFQLHVGSPVALILEEAAKSSADFIVMGSHGHGKLYDLLVGSTASGVIKKAKCGVIILPPEEKHQLGGHAIRGSVGEPAFPGR